MTQIEAVLKNARPMKYLIVKNLNAILVTAIFQDVKDVRILFVDSVN